MQLDESLVDQVVALCQTAGQTILEVYHSQETFTVSTKDDNSPVTAADLAAHAILEPGLAALIPGVPVLSEEGEIPSFDTRRHWGTYWIIDPLDGTKEFLLRNDEFTVNVALIHHNEPHLGVVHVPVYNQTYTGQKGGRAYKITATERRPIHTRALTDNTQEQPVVMVASRHYGATSAADLLRRISDTLGSAVTTSMGSSLKFCHIAEGLADFYPRLAPTCEWDTAAAQAVIEAAGGCVLSAEGLTPLRYNQTDNLLNPFFYVIGDLSYDWHSLLKNKQ